jgi:hypothetical protein
VELDKAQGKKAEGRACRSGFATLPPMPLQEQPTMVLLLEGTLVSWSLAMDERGRHEDLCGLIHRNVIPYIHGRTELYCTSIYETEPFFDLLEVASTRAFYTSRSSSYNETQGLTRGPRWLKSYTTFRALMARSS